ncbi:glycosyltransferase family 4 protein [Herbaspirillum sp.]|uniref:glycosyltransferase family 4 protein n=1 Tax=Herbaspirillum sp. TaxID=1890675 RepID=UPI001B1EC697|nr:glycosyltransferase family 4 protein [Herbaspirillum sp.]MBO9536947.1 glycosyltransferase family 4 protein [Herbaspirillum sp.]
MKTKMAIVATSEMTIKAFLREHIDALRRRHAVTVIVNTGEPGFLAALGMPDVRVIPVNIARQISPWKDLSVLSELVRIMFRERFDIVFSVTPKGGLLGMLSGFVARVPVRIHMFTGQVWATRSGMARRILKAADRLIARLATRLLVDSESQRLFLVEEKVVASARCRVLAEGSICGVDTERFRPDAGAREMIRRELGIAGEVPVVLFLGRLNRDKGVLDLAQAMADLSAAGRDDWHLLVVGPDEGGLRARMKEICAMAAERLHFVDYTDQPQKYMAAADIFCLPSYREGFGSVVIEAAAVGVPALASRIYGLTDAVDDGRTGLLFAAADVPDLARNLSRMLDDPALRQVMGENARQRAQTLFSSKAVTAAFVAYIDACRQEREASRV